MEAETVGYAGAVAITGIKKGTLYFLVSERRIPHIRIGKRHVVFSVNALRKWLTKHEVKVQES